MGSEDVLNIFLLSLSVCSFSTQRREQMSLTFIQSGENLTEGNVRIA